MEKLVIISNEKVSKNSQQEFKSINLDLQILPDELNKFFEVSCVFRKSKIDLNHKYDTKKIFIGSSIFTFIFGVIKNLFYCKKYLIVAISPYTFLSFLILFLSRKKIYVYLMSNGYEEYEYILGKKFVWIYDLMFKLMTKFSKVIVCHERLFRKDKSFVVSPSRLSRNWMEKTSLPKLDIPRLLYVGRINPEKGIVNFIEMFEEIDINSEIYLAGNTEKLKISSNKIKKLGYLKSEEKLIKAYDECNITILPSYTEAHPYVLEESLSRKRPIIIFEDIAYVKKNKEGVFIIKRNKDDIHSKISWIINNYQKIQSDMEKNKLPTKKSMLMEFCKIIK